MKNFVMWYLKRTLRKVTNDEDWDLKTQEEFNELSDDDKFRYQHGLPVLGSNNTKPITTR